MKQKGGALLALGCLGAWVLGFVSTSASGFASDIQRGEDKLFPRLRWPHSVAYLASRVFYGRKVFACTTKFIQHTSRPAIAGVYPDEP